MKIIYLDADNRLVVVSPTGEIPIEEVGRKDVPTGIPYLIVPEVPTETPSFANPAGFGADYGAGSGWAVTAYMDNGVAAIVERLVDDVTGETESAFVNGYEPPPTPIVEEPSAAPESEVAIAVQADNPCECRKGE